MHTISLPVSCTKQLTQFISVITILHKKKSFDGPFKLWVIVVERFFN